MKKQTVIQLLLLPLLVMTLIFTGCVRVNRHSASSKTEQTHYAPGHQDDQWLVFRQHAEGNDAVFESEKVTLIFPNLTRRERDSFDGEALPIQIAGQGSSETTRTCNRNGRITTFHARYKGGISTITFCGREVKLADSARKVILADKTIDLNTADLTVTVVALSE